MPTTTAQLIREQQAGQIQALSSDQLGGVPFREYDRLTPFAEWAEANPAAALRRFHIEDLATYEIPLGGDSVSEEVTTQFLVSVAYPLDNRYGEDGTNGLVDAINQDRRKIQNAIGIHGYGSYVSGHNRCALADSDIEREGKVWFLRLTFDINF